MATSAERAPHERETLIFPNAEQAGDFQERVAERLEQAQQPGVTPRREVIGQALQEEFDRAGEGVDRISHPWDHSQTEHAEVQQLVDAAFAHDLPAALKAARRSPHYPRNIDLFHDVLTTEMYDVLHDSHVRKQSLALPLVLLSASLVLVLFLIILLVVL